MTSFFFIRHPTPRISFRRLALHAPSEHGPENPFSPLHRDALRGKEHSLLRYLMILHLRPQRPRGFHLPKVDQPLVLPLLLLNADTRRGDHLLHQMRLLLTLGVQYNALLLRGPRHQAQASHPELHSLSLLQFLRFLLICHRSLLSDSRCSQHRPLRATQIVERNLSIRSYILIRRSCDSSLSSKTLTAYCRGTTLSTL